MGELTHKAQGQHLAEQLIWQCEKWIKTEKKVCLIL